MFYELPMCIPNFLKLYFIYWLVIKQCKIEKENKKVISCQDMKSNLTHLSDRSCPNLPQASSVQNWEKINVCHSHGAVCHTGMLVMAVLEANTHPSLHSPDMRP